jgi:predicted lipoprotein
MRLILGLLILASLLAAGPSAAFDKAQASKVMANAVDGYIRPAYADFHAKASALTAATEAFCASPDGKRWEVVLYRFGDTALSWSRIEFLRLGPVMEQNRLERILFYPDRKSTGLKQVRALFAKPDAHVLDVAALKTRSVAIQGLGAFDVVFFRVDLDRDFDGWAGFRCGYGLAVAKNIESIAAELQSAWDAPDGIARDWKMPGADNPVYRDENEAVAALIGITVHGLEMVRDQRIAQFYKGKGLKVSPKRAIYWRSGFTMHALKANVDGLAKFWTVTDIASLLDPDMHSLSESVIFDLKSASSALATLGEPTELELADTKYLGKLDFITFNLKDAMTRIDSDVGGAIGLGAGFSFADGD